MNRCFKLLLLLSALLFILGCEPAPYSSKNYDWFAVASHSVPNGFFQDGAAKTTFLEQDSYGRVLFEYRVSIKYAYSHYQYAYVVCQKSDEEYAYYYEDDCFIAQEGAPEFSDSAVEALKDANDWDKPLNAERLSRRPIRRDGWRYADGQITAAALSKMTEQIEANLADSEHSLSSQLMDVDQNGNCLFFVDVYSSVSKEDRRWFFVLFDQNQICDPDTGIERVLNKDEWQKQLHAFKLANDWIFGID